MDSQDLDLQIPAQGISLTLSPEKAKEFFQNEIEYFGKLQSLLSENFVFHNANYGQTSIVRNSQRILQEILKSISGEDRTQLEKYQVAARDLRVLVGQGNIGEYIKSLPAGDSAEARWLVHLCSPDWIGNGQVVAEIAPFRAAMSGNPARLIFTDANAASQALRDAGESKVKSAEALQELKEFISEKTSILSNLEDMYRKKLVLEEPAVFWQNKARAKTTLWILWLVVFGALVLIPIGIVARDWEAFALIISRLTTGASGVVSLTGIAALTVPALFYAWLLKNVSRIFIQNLSLADDAGHRRALAITYLGLAANPKLAISETDRALILNALFRPIPPNSLDDGPPSGLLELIKK